MSDFYTYFKENMDGLGLPAPESPFGTLQAAVGSAKPGFASRDTYHRYAALA
jgi:hypothetical protein